MFPLVPILVAGLSGAWFFIAATRSGKAVWLRVVLAVCGIVAFFVAFAVIGVVERTLLKDVFSDLLRQYGDQTVALVHTLLAGVLAFLSGLPLARRPIAEHTEAT
jgi:hypothetical protein